jgi:hypothetical protein
MIFIEHIILLMIVDYRISDEEHFTKLSGH